MSWNQVLLYPEGARARLHRARLAGLAQGLGVRHLDLKTAVASSKSGGKLELLVDNAETFSTHSLEYREGARYPRLERDASRPDLLTAILTPTAPPLAGAH